MRPRSGIKFCYKIHKGIACPIVPLEIYGVKIDAYVDSGAFVSIFSTQEAEALGIDYRKGRTQMVTVGDGNLIPVFYHILPIKIGCISLQATLGFSPRLGVGFNLLGRKDIFEKFVIIFDDAKRMITFLPRPHC